MYSETCNKWFRYKGWKEVSQNKRPAEKRSNRNKQFSLSTFVPSLRRQLNSNPVLMKAVSALELFNLLCGVDNIAGLSSTWAYYSILYVTSSTFNCSFDLTYFRLKCFLLFLLYLCMHPTVRTWRISIIYNVISRYLKKILIFCGGFSCSLINP